MTFVAIGTLRVKCPKIYKTFHFLFSNKILVFRAGIHKMLIKVSNKEDPDQTASSLLLQKQSDLDLCYLSRLLRQETTV